MKTALIAVMVILLSACGGAKTETKLVQPDHPITRWDGKYTIDASDTTGRCDKQTLIDFSVKNGIFYSEDSKVNGGVSVSSGEFSGMAMTDTVTYTFSGKFEPALTGEWVSSEGCSGFFTEAPDSKIRF